MEIQQIQEINKLTQMTRVPQAPEDVLGILNLRGQIVTIIDLARRLGLGATEPTSQARIIIVNTAGGKVGILVRRISDVVAVDLRSKEAAAGQHARHPGAFLHRGVQAGKRPDRPAQHRQSAQS